MAHCKRRLRSSGEEAVTPPPPPLSLPDIPSSPSSTKSGEISPRQKKKDGEAFDESLSSHTSMLLPECLHVPPFVRSPSPPPPRPFFLPALRRIRISQGASQWRGEVPEDSPQPRLSPSGVEQRLLSASRGSGAAQLVRVRSCLRDERASAGEGARYRKKEREECVWMCERVHKRNG